MTRGGYDGLGKFVGFVGGVFFGSGLVGGRGGCCCLFGLWGVFWVSLGGGGFGVFTVGDCGGQRSLLFCWVLGFGVGGVRGFLRVGGGVWLLFFWGCCFGGALVFLFGVAAFFFLVFMGLVFFWWGAWVVFLVFCGWGGFVWWFGGGLIVGYWFGFVVGGGRYSLFPPFCWLVGVVWGFGGGVVRGFFLGVFGVGGVWGVGVSLFVLEVFCGWLVVGGVCVFTCGLGVGTDFCFLYLLFWVGGVFLGGLCWGYLCFFF